MKKLGMSAFGLEGTRHYRKTGIISGQYKYTVTKEEYKKSRL